MSSTMVILDSYSLDEIEIVVIRAARAALSPHITMKKKIHMDFVEDPKALLRTMEANSIGTKRSLFYQAYALHYEKIKRFEEAEKMYRLGVQNLAEPMDELEKSYLQFLTRMERHKKKKDTTSRTKTF